MTAFQLVAVPILTAVATAVFVSTLRRRVPWRTGLLWSALWVAAAVSIAFPGLTIVAARSVGIGRGADLVLYGTAIGSLGASLYFYGRCRRLEEMITILARRDALRSARHGRTGRQPAPDESTSAAA